MNRNSATRLAAFALVIAGSFGTAYGMGRKLPGNPESRPHTHSSAPSPVAPAFTVDGYTLVADADQPTSAALTLHVNRPDGQRVTEFAEAHGSKLHVVLIRPDLSGFEHVHPDIAADGSFVVAVAEPGALHIVIDVKPAGAANSIALATNVDDERPYDTTPLPAAADVVTVDGLTVSRQGLVFTVTASDGSSTDGLEPYLGQPAHLIAVRQGDLAYSHLHPSSDAMIGMFAFDGSLPAGTYRLFLQFGFRGDVRTVGFTVVQP
jgi:hypothetical protein